MDVRFAVERGQVIDFSVCLTLVEGVEGVDEYEVIRYDSAHGSVHVHRFYVRDPGRHREDCPARNLNDGLTQAISDVQERSEKYVEWYRRNILGRA